MLLAGYINDDEVKAQELDVEAYVMTLWYIVKGNRRRLFERSNRIPIYQGKFLFAFVGI